MAVQGADRLHTEQIKDLDSCVLGHGDQVAAGRVEGDLTEKKLKFPTPSSKAKTSNWYEINYALYKKEAWIKCFNDEIEK